MPANADRLTSQLANIADIIGDLGLNIAEAQKELNAGYLDSLKVLVAIIKSIDPGKRNASTIDILKALAPPRYQYTETVLDFSADLSETKQQTIGGVLTANFSAVAVSASMAQSFGYDYRAAARITSTLSAYPNPGIADKLLARAENIRSAAANLPPAKGLDKDLQDKALALIDALGEGEDDPAAPEADASALAPDAE